MFASAVLLSATFLGQAGYVPPLPPAPGYGPAPIDGHRIDAIAARLAASATELHEEHHRHLQSARHGAKLDADLTRLEELAGHIHELVHGRRPDAAGAGHLREDANDLLHLVFRVERTLDRVASWALPQDARAGIDHMRQEVARVQQAAFQLDAFLPTDMQVVDRQSVRMAQYVRELHDEFHEHLESYQMAAYLDRDLEELEELADHMAELTRTGHGGDREFRHLGDDLRRLARLTAHVDRLVMQQASIGVLTHDWVGIEHLRDVLTDVEASSRLMGHLIAKAAHAPTRHGRTSRYHDRYGHNAGSIHDHR